MTRAGRVFMQQILAGKIVERDDGNYAFTYDQKYRETVGVPPISLTLPVRAEPYVARQLLPFFDGLIPEGWLLDLHTRNWKLDARDRMGLLLSACRDCIGAVHVEPETDL